MMRRTCVVVAFGVVALLACAAAASAQAVIRTVAGGGPPDGLLATAVGMTSPGAVTVDSAGNIYVATLGRVLKIDATGHLTTVAGNGGWGYGGDGGPATSATLGLRCALAVDGAGHLFIADANNNRIREVNGGIITTVAGNGTAAFGGDGGDPLSASLWGPSGIAFDPSGNLFIADSGNSRVRRISGGVITTVAGTGTSTFSGDGGAAINAGIGPSDVAFDAGGSLYIADNANFRIRKVTGGIITTIAGNGSYTASGDGGPATSAGVDPFSLAVSPAGDVFIADSFNYAVRRVSGGIISTAAGLGVFEPFGGDGGPATAAPVDPQGIALDASGNLLIADGAYTQTSDGIAGGGHLRKVAGGIITSIAGDGFPGSEIDGDAATRAQVYPNRAAIGPDGAIYFTDHYASVIWRVSGGVITRFAGTGSSGFSGDGGPATSASLNDPAGLAFDAAGDLYVADANSGRVRRISGGIITTVAGGGHSGDGALATDALLCSPAGLAFGSDGSMYIADQFGQRVRRVSNGIIDTVAGSATACSSPGAFSGDGGPATSAKLKNPVAIAVAADGTLFIADEGNNRIRKVANGIISTLLNVTAGDLQIDAGGTLIMALTTANQVYKRAGTTLTAIAGTGAQWSSGDGGLATAASLDLPFGIAVDATGNVFIAEYERVREVLTPQQPTISWPVPADIVFGTPLGGGQLDATATVNGNPVSGTFAYSPPPGTLLNAGAAQTLSVTFTPDDPVAYPPVSGSVLINVLKATPTLTWPAPADILQGTALSSTQLNAAATLNGNPVAGTYQYTPPAGTVLPLGASQTLQVLFTPTDAADYTTASTSVFITVSAAPNLTMTASSAPLQASPGMTIDISSTVMNSGPGAVGSFRVGLYLSTDATCTPADTLLASRVVAGLASGASSAATTTATIPGGTPLGGAFLCAIADDLAQAAESNEADNTRAIAIAIVPPTPTVTLKINGQHPSPAVVTTNGPFALTLDIAESSYTAPLSWYWAILVNNQLVWITSAGASATAAPLAVAPPAALTNVSLITSTLPAGSTLTSFFFFVDNNGATVALDAIAVTRPLP